MVKHIAAVLTVVLTAGLASAQIAPTRVYSYPLVPSKETLHNLNMKLAWRTFLPVDDSRDGIATVQVMGDKLFMQLRNGAVVVVNADTGQQIWRARFGPPYKVTQALGFNYDTVFGINTQRLFALDRATGKLKYEMDLPNVPTTPPVGDAQRVYLGLTGSRMVAYRLPIPDIDLPPLEKNKDPGYKPDNEKAKAGPPLSVLQESGTRKSALGNYYPSESWVTTPLVSPNKPPSLTFTPLASAIKTSQSLSRGYELPLAWEYSADSRLELPPLVSLNKGFNTGYLVLAAARGQLYGSSKVQRSLVYSFQSEPISAPMAQYGDIAYIPYEDATLTAMNIETGRLLWRIAVGGVTRSKLQVTDEDLYMTPERAGLYRLNRATGEVVWQNQTAQRFLAANRKFVYAIDASNKLLIIDRARGTQLSSFDIRDYQVTIQNDYTDRIFLASHDGLLICLYDRDYETPAWNKQLVEEKKPEPRKPGAELKMENKAADK